MLCNGLGEHLSFKNFGLGSHLICGGKAEVCVLWRAQGQDEGTPSVDLQAKRVVRVEFWTYRHEEVASPQFSAPTFQRLQSFGPTAYAFELVEWQFLQCLATVERAIAVNGTP